MTTTNRRSIALAGILALGGLGGCGKSSAPPAATGEIKPSAEDRKVLIERLKSENPGERMLAAGVLAMHGPEAQDALPALSAAEKDPDPAVRAAVAKAIAAIKGSKPAK